MQIYPEIIFFVNKHTSRQAGSDICGLRGAANFNHMVDTLGPRPQCYRIFGHMLCICSYKKTPIKLVVIGLEWKERPSLAIVLFQKKTDFV